MAQIKIRKLPQKKFGLEVSASQFSKISNANTSISKRQCHFLGAGNLLSEEKSIDQYHKSGV